MNLRDAESALPRLPEPAVAALVECGPTARGTNALKLGSERANDPFYHSRGRGQHRGRAQAHDRKRDAAAGGAGAAGSRGVRTRSEGLEAGNGAVIDDRTAVVVGLLRQSFPRWTDLPGERAPTGARLTKLTRIRRALARRAVRGCTSDL